MNAERAGLRPHRREGDEAGVTASPAPPLAPWSCSSEPAPPGEPYADVVETHTSVLVFAGGLVYKAKKPVVLAFVDLGSAEARWRNCERELALNREFAPDVYLGISELRPASAEGRGEPLLVLRRMPRSRRLSALLRAGEDVHPHLAAVAAQLAAYHARQRPAWGWPLAGTLGELWREGLDQLDGFAGRVLERAELDHVAALAREFLAGRRGLLDDRERAGLVRPGHGDLLAEDVFCLADGPRVLDCLEFDERLRVGDVLLDAAFLAMDLEAHGDADAGRWFLDRYLEAAGSSAPAALVHHYVGYRAFVRAKVACLRHDQGDTGAGDHARALLRLCRQHLEAGRARLVVVGGLPGSGKTSLCEAVARADAAGRDWLVLSTDVVRKELAGAAPTQHCAADYEQGIYTPAWTEASYAELLRRAGVALRSGVDVLLDGSWNRATQRTAARELARSAAAALTEIRCVAPADVCARRVRHRQGSASDADADVLAAMAAVTDAWPEGHVVDTSGDVAAGAAAVHAVLAATPPPADEGSWPG